MEKRAEAARQWREEQEARTADELRRLAELPKPLLPRANP